jgi:SAM-dependent methyltransferase
MLTLAEVRRNDIVYDLGCGDGRIVITAAYRHGARGVGIDIDPQRVAEANAKARTLHLEGRVKFIQDDLFGFDFAPASVVMLYLSDELNQKLRPKLLAELKPGTRIVSHHFGMGDWKPERIVRAGEDTLFLWRVPAPE